MAIVKLCGILNKTKTNKFGEKLYKKERSTCMNRREIKKSWVGVVTSIPLVEIVTE